MLLGSGFALNLPNPIFLLCRKTNFLKKERTRARVEHIFGFVENSMNGSIVRTKDMVRAEAKIGLMNWVYTIFLGCSTKKTSCHGISMSRHDKILYPLKKSG